MKFSDFVSNTAIRPNLAAVGKEDVVREMTTALVEAGAITEGELESTIKAITKREELGSTGIGRGVAVPHTKHPSVDRLIGTVGVSAEGVDFKSLDGEMVHLFFLLSRRPIDLVTICVRWKIFRDNYGMTRFVAF